MKKTDKILIQKKTDGNLSTNEEKEFEQLISKSPNAKQFYNQLLEIEETLRSDSANTKEIDLQTPIMKTIKKRNNKKNIKLKIFNPNSLEYAAILIIGFLLGSTSIVLYHNNQPLNNKQLVGTLAKAPEKNVVFSNATTIIKIQSTQLDSIKLSFVTIETTTPIDIVLTSSAKEIHKDKIIALINTANFELKGRIDNQLKYRVKGNTIFQIENKNTKQLILYTLKDDTEIFKYKME